MSGDRASEATEMHLGTGKKPVQFTVFEDNWRQMAERTAAENMRFPPYDPRFAAGVDILMELGVHSNPDAQARWDPQLIKQGQKIDIGAILKTIETAATKTQYVKITQSLEEPFLQFVEKIAAALEKHIGDDNVRQLLCKQLAKGNANADCSKIIEALPRDPSLTDMV
ncbi:hypothetical protein HGM15179_020352 [Zosterops borbonicus]|uniref:Retroviral nucleocapsid Gag protein p24 C-terminal domain-containing protein n=1 Tax=Zosterops borbonicus TaxID=364589 RepID=A0A8K1FYG7_9PASS|nr:hypothetical protein HGM15179_020352 [Zosterops borbonicus]